MFFNEEFGDAVIAPGMSGAYRFIFENANEDAVEYSLTFREENEYGIALKYRLVRDGAPRYGRRVSSRRGTGRHGADAGSAFERIVRTAVVLGTQRRSGHRRGRRRRKLYPAYRADGRRARAVTPQNRRRRFRKAV